MAQASNKQGFRAVFLASCPDQKGIVATLSRFIFDHGGNIVDSDQHTDHEAKIFAIRLEWELDEFSIPHHEVADRMRPIADRFRMQWSLSFSNAKPRMAVWVSRQDHCLIDLLGRQRAGDIRGTIELIISNHEMLRPVAEQFAVPFFCFPITPENKKEQEEKERKLIEQYRIDLVVLAKYMQVLTNDFLNALPSVINIHHSFLPAFAGANPYHRAFERGVKLIGATAHFATEDLDEGPIITQDVTHISHRDSVPDLVRKGKDLEKIVLAHAVYLHLERRVLVYGNKTVIFE